MAQMIPCPACEKKPGLCPSCGGTGGGITYQCSLCKGQKHCPICKGKQVIQKR